MILVQLKIQKRLLTQWRGLLSLQKKELHLETFLFYLMNYENKLKNINFNLYLFLFVFFKKLKIYY